jgi:hypothetical protein
MPPHTKQKYAPPIPSQYKQKACSEDMERLPLMYSNTKNQNKPKNPIIIPVFFIPTLPLSRLR